MYFQSLFIQCPNYFSLDTNSIDKIYFGTKNIPTQKSSRTKVRNINRISILLVEYIGQSGIFVSCILFIICIIYFTTIYSSVLYIMYINLFSKFMMQFIVYKEFNYNYWTIELQIIFCKN